MIDKIKEHIAVVEAFTTKSKEDLELFRVKYLGNKGLLKDFFPSLKMFQMIKKRIWSSNKYTKNKCRRKSKIYY